MNALLKIRDFSLFCGKNKILDNINMDVFEGEILAVAGESGSGKSMLARSVLRLNDPKKFKTNGIILFEEEDINALPEKRLSKIRGAKIGMIFQEPLSYLNPVLKMGVQLNEAPIRHKKVRKREAILLMEDLLEKLKINNPSAYMKSYPHQLSGGMAQRGAIAIAASCRPRIIIADETTSSLDVITQASIIRLIKDLARVEGISVVFITHDLQLASRLADRVVIIEKGRIAEEGCIRKVFDSPKSKAASCLIRACMMGNFKKSKDSIDSKNSIIMKEHSVIKENKKPVLEVQNLSMHYKNGRGNIIRAVDDISLEVFEGETLGILGESGSGKSTLARIVTRIQKPLSGKVVFEGTDIFGRRDYPRHVQMVFQDPFSSIDPQMRIEDIVAEGMDMILGKNRWNRVEEVARCLQKVGLDESLKDRYPHQLSGGQRQRVGIARAVIMNPKIIVCDEPTAYLDTVSQMQILELFMKLKKENGISYVFITHNIRVLSSISDRIAVMLGGRIVETGRTEDIINNPVHPYTKILINAASLNEEESKGNAN